MSFTRLSWLSLGALLVASGVGSGVADAHAGPAPTATPTAAAPVVTMITGDRVAVGPNRLLSGTPLASYVDATGDRYLVPATALGHLNRPLDQSLFDVTALAKQPAPARLRLTYAAGVTPTAPPGITLTSTSGNTALGYQNSAPAFVAALNQDPGALAPGLDTIALASQSTVVSPHYVLHPTQLNVTPLPGSTDTPFSGAYLMNTDTGGQAESVPVYDNVGRVQLPAGHYVGIVEFDQLGSGKTILSSRVVATSFTVPSTTGTTTNVDFVESTASNQVGIAATPRPATQNGLTLTLTGQRSDGTTVGTMSVFSWPGQHTALYVNSLAPLAVGKLRYLVNWSGVAPTATDGYRYDVSFPTANGIPADESYRVLPSELTTAHLNVYNTANSGAANGDLQVLGRDPAVADLIPSGDSPIAMPSTVTDYLGTADGGQWAHALTASPGPFIYGQPQTFTRGRDYTVEFNHAPLAPSFATFSGAQPFCLACATGTGQLIFRYGDDGNEPAQYGSIYANPTSAALTLYANGTQVYAATGWDAAANGVWANLALPSTPTTMRAVFDLDLSGVTGFLGSATSHTDLTFRYNPTPTAQDTLPAEVYQCPATPTSPCQVLPVLTTAYQLATDPTDVSNAPLQTMRLRVGHLSYDGQGSHASITSVTVNVSVDGGTTWQPAVVGGVGGDYFACWPNVANTHPMLKVTATDAAGGSLSQTITNAYTVASTLATH